jgi:hypothetical protein
VNWRTDKSWSDRFIPEIKTILGRTLIEVAPADEDALRNTDLITLSMRGGLRVACRIRKHEYLAKYGDEFTLRCSRPSGRDTEIDKLLDGWGDYIFYGFSDEHHRRLAAWLVGDLRILREWIASYHRDHKAWPGEIKANRDGSSQFLVFRISDVDPRFVVARQIAACLAA